MDFFQRKIICPYVVEKIAIWKQNQYSDVQYKNIFVFEKY